MIDRDLAEMYGVETRRLNEQVKRNEKCFRDDFMFQLTEQELEDWKPHFATSNREDWFEKIDECIHGTRCSHALKCFES